MGVEDFQQFPRFPHFSRFQRDRKIVSPGLINSSSSSNGDAYSYAHERSNKCACMSHFQNWERYFAHNEANREIYNPMNLASIICTIFASHEDALIQAFIDDLVMFEHLYEFLPKDISVEVLNTICLSEAIRIVKNNQCSSYVYRDIDPILYVCRYYQNRKCNDPVMLDPHCVEFDTSIIPQTSTLNFVLKCKKQLTEEEFSDFIHIAAPK